jgi:hypothetical protein
MLKDYAAKLFGGRQQVGATATGRSNRGNGGHPGNGGNRGNGGNIGRKSRQGASLLQRASARLTKK